MNRRSDLEHPQESVIESKEMRGDAYPNATVETTASIPRRASVSDEGSL